MSLEKLKLCYSSEGQDRRGADAFLGWLVRC